MTESITINLPGKFNDFFSGSSVGQGQTSLEATGYPGAPGLYAAYLAAERRKVGKGYSYRLTIPVDEHTDDVLRCLWEYADTCYWVNLDEPETRDEARAGQVVRDRVEGAQAALAKQRAAACSHEGTQTNDDGTATCLYCGKTGTQTATPNARGGTDYSITWQ